MISDYLEVQNNEITDLKLTFLPVGYRYFQSQFVMIIEQESMPPSVYEFYQKSKKVNDTGSELFQTVPQRTVGNMLNVNKNGRPIVGIFSVGSTQSDTIRIVTSDVPYTIDPPPYSTLPCQEAFVGETTNQKPIWF